MYEIVCPICLIALNSHLSWRESGRLMDDHTKAKHPETITDPDSVVFGESPKLRRQ